MGSQQVIGSITVRDSVFTDCGTAIYVPTPWSVGDPLGLRARDTIIDNVRFSNNSADVSMAFSLEEGANIAVANRVFVTKYNGIAGDDFRVYAVEQSADFIMPQTTRTDSFHGIIGSSAAGLTNAQNRQQFGASVFDAITPSNATTRPLIGGMVAPM